MSVSNFPAAKKIPTIDFEKIPTLFLKREHSVADRTTDHLCGLPAILFECCGDLEVPQTDTMAADLGSSPERKVEVKKEKKRKRADPNPDELEIDVNLPEPPSKKALRRAKKGKTGDAPRQSLKDDSDLRGEKDADGALAGDTAAADSTTADTESTTKQPVRSAHGIWIGNLAFHITPTTLRQFLTSSGSLTSSQITRVNLPVTNRPLAPFQIRTLKTAGQTDIPQFQNKGFAYVDLDSPEALFQALQVTETLFEGRKVLIKDAKNFAGRPDKPKPSSTEGAAAAAAPGIDGKPPSKRIFVGNLAFDVTREDVETHFSQAGTVEDVFLASFEDSGKCKGYGWVRFEDEEAATKAVKGWIWKVEDDEDDAESDDEDESGEKDKAKKEKKRKWWINKLFGRQLRCEFAEDASTRYKKRYGKGGTKRMDQQQQQETGEEGGETFEAPPPRERRPFKSRDARKVAPGQALASAPRNSAAIVEAKGTKVTFDD